ncbi:MAG: GTPase [Bdellovibrionota bacterium]
MDYFKRLEIPIAAAATAQGGPLVVYRVSGKNLDALTEELGLSSADDRLAKHQNIFGIDQGLVVFFKAPKSFTGENVIEFHVHGSDRICESLMSELKKRNVIEALPGEFTFRALANDKMTLAEAESLHVALSLASATPLSSKLVNLSESAQKETDTILSELANSLTAARGRLESAIDFSEASEEQAGDVESCQEKLLYLNQRLDRFLTAYQNFSLTIREPKVLIVGEPNSGKSSLLNLLLGSERSLVSDTPGTTRDYIEARVKLQNQNFIFVDTAGIRGLEGEKIDALEKRGIDRALQFLNEAHAVLWVKPVNQKENVHIKKLLSKHPLVVELSSYGDTVNSLTAFDLRSEEKKLRSFLENTLLKKLHIYRQDREVEFFLSERQYSLLCEVQEFVQRANEALSKDRPYELVAEDLKLADKALKKCCGKELSNDYISEIFSQFCLGK